MVGAVSADVVKPIPQAAGIELPAIIGKLPAHGDFIARGVVHRTRDLFDRWMAGWIEKGRSELAEGFDDVYLSAPPWLFESKRLKAVLIPSVDAVGRRFPALALASADIRTQSLYDALIKALEDGQSGDDFRASVASLDSETAPEQTTTDAESPGKWFLPEGAQSGLPSPADAEGWSDVEGLLI